MNLYNLTPYQEGMEDGKICRGCKNPNCQCKDPYILTKNGMMFLFKDNYIGTDENGEKVVIAFAKEEYWDDKPGIKPGVMIIRKEQVTDEVN